MNVRLIQKCVCMFVVCVCGCTIKQSGPVVVALVNGREITSADIKKELILTSGQTLRDELRKAALSENPRVQAGLKLQILSKLLDELLLEEEAKNRGINVSSKEVQQELNALFRSYPGGFTVYSAVHSGVSIRDVKENLKRQLLIKKLLEQEAGKVKISEEEIKKYYDSHSEEFYQSDRVRARQIVVPDLSRAKKILELLQRPGGRKRFAEYARKYSISPEAKDGGDLGYFSEDEVPPQFNVCFKLRRGEVSRIVKSPYGYHIFMVEDRQPGRQRSFEEVKEEIRNLLMERKRKEIVQNFITRLRSKAEIVVYEDRLAGVSLF